MALLENSKMSTGRWRPAAPPPPPLLVAPEMPGRAGEWCLL